MSTTSQFLLGFFSASILACTLTANPFTDDVSITTTTSDSTPELEVTGADGVLFKGTLGQGGNPAEGLQGPLMMWYPGKGAFRAGATLSGTDSLIGNYSWAGGSLAIASGYHTFAFGADASASGDHSFAFGATASASGVNSFAFGNSAEVYAGGTAIGRGSYASDDSVTLGRSSAALGGGSIVIGRNVVAEDHDMILIGKNLYNLQNHEIVIGRYNHGHTSDFSDYGQPYTNSSRFFTLANGTGVQGDPNKFSHALVMRQSGDTRVSGMWEFKGGIRTKAMGDISMGAFTVPGNDPATLDTSLKYPGE